MILNQIFVGKTETARRLLLKLIDELPIKVNLALEKTLIRLIEKAKLIVSYHTPIGATGDLRRSIATFTRGIPVKYGEVGTPLKYGVPIEYGTPPTGKPPPYGPGTPLDIWVKAKRIPVPTRVIAFSIARKGISMWALRYLGSKGYYMFRAGWNWMRDKVLPFFRRDLTDILRR